MVASQVKTHIIAYWFDFANSLDPGQDQHNVGPELGPNRLTLNRVQTERFF